jgi:hypothetical protein
MNHIQSKKSFESVEQASDVVSDICIELEDKGFKVVHHNNLRPNTPDTADVLISIPYSDFQVHTTHSFPLFKYSDVEEVVERLKDYLGDKIISVKFKISNTWYLEHLLINSHSSQAQIINAVQIHYII